MQETAQYFEKRFFKTVLLNVFQNFMADIELWNLVKISIQLSAQQRVSPRAVLRIRIRIRIHRIHMFFLKVWWQDATLFVYFFCFSLLCRAENRTRAALQQADALPTEPRRLPDPDPDPDPLVRGMDPDPDPALDPDPDPFVIVQK